MVFYSLDTVLNYILIHIGLISIIILHLLHLTTSQIVQVVIFLKRYHI